jgi:hypothetical protein
MQTHDTRSTSWTWRRQTEVDELDAAVTALHAAADTSPDPERAARWAALASELDADLTRLTPDLHITGGTS